MSTSFIIIYSDINRFLLYEWSGFLQGWQFLPDTHLISIPSSGIKYLPCDPALRDSGRKVLSNIIILLLCWSRHLSGTTTYIISFYLLNNGTKILSAGVPTARIRVNEQTKVLLQYLYIKLSYISVTGSAAESTVNQKSNV